MKTIKLFALALAVCGLVASEADAGGRRSRRCNGGSCSTTVTTCTGGSCGQVVTTTSSQPAQPAKPATPVENKTTTTNSTVNSCTTIHGCSSCGTVRTRRGR